MAGLNETPMNQAETTSEALSRLAQRAKDSGLFTSVEIESSCDRLECRPNFAGDDASYRLEPASDGWEVSLVTPDRWLSESIESDLMHSGDSVEELVEEELVDLGAETGVVVVKHFRSPDMLYTFRTPLPPASTTDDAYTWLMAYEAAFRALGDMNPDAAED